MRIAIIYFFILLNSQFAGAQTKWLYTFNSCSEEEQNKLAPALQFSAVPLCDCGLENDALELNNQSVSLPLELDTFFFSDFSLGFSVLLEPGSGNLDLLSKMNVCNADTSMSVIYQSKDSTFVCSFQQGFDKIVQLVGKADPSRCWQEVMLVRSNGQFRLFINGKLKDESFSGFIVRLNNKRPVRFNASPCSFVSRSKGFLDHLLFFNYALNSTQVLDEYQQQDEILTPDTLIFLGASFVLRAKADCANQVSWQPSTGLSSNQILNPIASPVQETRYRIEIQNRFCRANDEILIKVIDTSKSDCNLLSLPTAFTPNGDNLNDLFGISNSYLVEKLEYLDIIDRNGGLMVRLNQASDQWDGSWKGSKLNPGTYYYRVSYTCKGKEYQKQGSFFLLR